MRKWLHDIHGITLGDDPESFLESMQLRGVKNFYYRKQDIKKKIQPRCGFEGWCESRAQYRCKGNCLMHFIDDSSGEPLAKLQSKRYIEVCDPEVRLYNEQREESIVFRNIGAIAEWCATHKFGQRSNEKGIICGVYWWRDREHYLRDMTESGSGRSLDD